MSADLITSLYRGERLGLAATEAMALGEPVIAAAWSGSSARIDHCSAFPVGYRPAPQKGSGGLYETLPSGTHRLWAEPGLASAVEWVLRPFAHGGVKASTEAAGLNAVGQYRAEAERGAVPDELATLWSRPYLIRKGSPDRNRRTAFCDRQVRRQRLAYKLTSTEAWRPFAGIRLLWLFWRVGGMRWAC